MSRCRTKERYNPTPTARQRAYHLWLMDNWPCACGCGCPSTVVHHPLQEHPAQKWRRNHEYVVPMNGLCHMKLHRMGSEEAFIPGLDFAKAAHGFRLIGIGQGKLNG